MKLVYDLRGRQEVTTARLGVAGVLHWQHASSVTCGSGVVPLITWVKKSHLSDWPSIDRDGSRLAYL
jgi:hypothetical protein